jgi:hypothetical protein
VIVDAASVSLDLVPLEEEEHYHNTFAGFPFADFGMDLRWFVVEAYLDCAEDTAAAHDVPSGPHYRSAENAAAAAAAAADSAVHVRLVDSTAAAAADSGVGVVPCNENFEGAGAVATAGDRVEEDGGGT